MGWFTGHSMSLTLITKQQSGLFFVGEETTHATELDSRPTAALHWEDLKGGISWSTVLGRKREFNALFWDGILSVTFQRAVLCSVLRTSGVFCLSVGLSVCVCQCSSFSPCQEASCLPLNSEPICTADLTACRGILVKKKNCMALLKPTVAHRQTVSYLSVCLQH